MTGFDSGNIQLVKQANLSQCWYASASMMYLYRQKTIPGLSALQVRDAADEGMWSFSAMQVLVNQFHFKAIAPPDLGLLDSSLLAALMMSVSGPVLCMGEYQPGVAGAGHVVVVYKVDAGSDTVYYADPFEPRFKEMEFKVFNRKLFKEMTPSCMMWLEGAR
jgi:hypothetical protein